MLYKRSEQKIQRHLLAWSLLICRNTTLYSVPVSSCWQGGGCEKRPGAAPRQTWPTLQWTHSRTAEPICQAGGTSGRMCFNKKGQKTPEEERTRSEKRETSEGTPEGQRRHSSSSTVAGQIFPAAYRAHTLGQSKGLRRKSSREKLLDWLQILLHFPDPCTTGHLGEETKSDKLSHSCSSYFLPSTSWGW